MFIEVRGCGDKARLKYEKLEVGCLCRLGQLLYQNCSSLANAGQRSVVVSQILSSLICPPVRFSAGHTMSSLRTRFPKHCMASQRHIEEQWAFIY